MITITENVKVWNDEVELTTGDGFLNITEDGCITVAGEVFDGFDYGEMHVSTWSDKEDLITFLEQALVLLKK